MSSSSDNTLGGSALAVRARPISINQSFDNYTFVNSLKLQSVNRERNQQLGMEDKQSSLFALHRKSVVFFVVGCIFFFDT